jgi:hypothetical protein
MLAPQQTFPVHDVPPALTRFPRLSATATETDLLCYDGPEALIQAPSNQVNHLLRAVHIAFANHLPLTLSPDAIWLTIAAGFGEHVNTFKAEFVEPPQPKVIFVLADYSITDRRFPWLDAFSALAEQAQEQFEPLAGALIADFSTSTLRSRLASQIVLMHSFRPFHRAVLRCICGIPAITLTGSVADWLRLRQKVEMLGSYGLDWWVGHLLPICSQFIRASVGDIDRAWWQDIYKVWKNYDVDNINGWITHLFPYLTDSFAATTMRNPLLEDASRMAGTDAFPTGICPVPITIATGRGSEVAQAEAGIIGATQDDDGKIAPAIALRVRRRARIDGLLDRLTRDCQTQRIRVADIHPPNYVSLAPDLRAFCCRFLQARIGACELRNPLELERYFTWNEGQHIPLGQLRGTAIWMDREGSGAVWRQGMLGKRVELAPTFADFLDEELSLYG